MMMRIDFFVAGSCNRLQGGVKPEEIQVILINDNDYDDDDPGYPGPSQPVQSQGGQGAGKPGQWRPPALRSQHETTGELSNMFRY